MYIIVKVFASRTRRPTRVGANRAHGLVRLWSLVKIIYTSPPLWAHMTPKYTIYKLY